SYQFFIDLLKHLDREDLNQLWRLVKDTLNNRPPTSDKEVELWVELSRLYEPDDEDQLRARIVQSSANLHIANEPASPLRDVSQGEACPTNSGFGADQDWANIAKTSTLPYDSAPKVTSPATDEGSMQQKLDELTALCTSLQRQHSAMVSKFKAQELEINMLKERVKLLEDKEGGGTERSRYDAPIKGRNLDEGEAAAERVSDDTKEMVTILTSMDAVSEVAKVSTGSGSIPTAGPPAAEVPTGSDVVPNAGLIFAIATVVTSYTRRKGKKTMVESETLKKKKVQEQIDAQVARELEEQMAREDQRMSEQLQAYQQNWMILASCMMNHLLLELEHGNKNQTGRMALEWQHDMKS
nr:hypothetical protein [Tanacetum cinerariifolium]